MTALFEHNIRAFLAFRLLFTVRFYYPVLAILFLDYGLTLGQFALLNTLWAAAIVVLEVPSGALADRWGRARMVRLASWLMTAEMAVLVVVPLGSPGLVLAAFALNRILSGMAEACASGADEALAYDSLKALGREGEWPAVLRKLMRWQAVCFAVAMLVGAAVYDPDLWNRVATWSGLEGGFTKTYTLRWPVILTLLTAAAACAVTARMTEPPGRPSATAGLREVWAQIAEAGQWILAHPPVVALLLAGLWHDSFIRLVLTLESEYLRVIGYPEVSLGLIAASLSGLGLLISPLAAWMDRKPGSVWKFAATTVAATAALAGISLWPHPSGLAWVVVLHGVFGLASYFLTHTLHARVDSAHRATVLSFKGLAFNLGYGGLGIVYAIVQQGGEKDFLTSLIWLPWAFPALMILVALWAGWRARSGSAR